MWTRKLCPALLFAGSLILFLYTLAPTVTFVDSGELIVTAHNLGVAHPPGFPLYILISHLATLVPLGNVAQRVHVVSAFSAALAVSVLYFITIEILLFLQTRTAGQNSGKPRSRKLPAFALERFTFIPGLVAGCLAAFSRTFWSYSTVAEVYTLNALLILLAFLFLLRWRSRALIRREQDAKLNPRGRTRKEGPSTDASKTQKKPLEYRLLYFAAFLFGLGLGVHHVTVALMLPAFAWLVYATEGMQFFRSRRLAICALACLIGASVYIYIPWAAAKAPVLNWGNPNTIERFWSHFTGRQYQSNFSFSAGQVGRELSAFMGLLFREFGWPWLPAGVALAGAGIISLFRNDRVLSISFALMIACNLIFAMGYEISEDKDAYYLPTFLVLAVAAGLGVSALLRVVRARSGWTAGLALLVPVTSLGGNFGINNRHDFYVAEDYVGNIFRTVAPNGLLLTGDWQVASPMLYFQEIVNRRPDVMCIDTLLLRRSWYCEYLKAKYPQLMHKSRNSLEIFMEDLRRWEREPEDFQKNPALVQRIEARYQSMIIALIQNHLPAAPVYATQDVVLNADPAGQPLAKSLLNKYQIVPKGLVFELFSDRAAHQTELPKLELRGLIDKSPAVREDSVVRQKVIPVYVTMLVNCGRAFSASGDDGRAFEAYRQAWAIDSSEVIARNLLPPGLSF